MSLSRFSYRFTGYGASVGVGFVFGGPYGAAVGTGFVAGEIVHDTGTQVKKEVGMQFNQFYRTLINGWINSRR